MKVNGYTFREGNSLVLSLPVWLYTAKAIALPLTLAVVALTSALFYL